MQRSSLVSREERERKKKGWKIEEVSVKRRHIENILYEGGGGKIPRQLFFIRRWME